MSVMGTLTAPFSVMTTATRHALDIDLGFGRASSRYNARDAYRTSYDAKSRYGAGLGTALGTIAPAAGLVAWTRYGMRVPGQAGVGLGLSRLAGAAALVGMAGVGASKLRQITEDDGHLGAVGSTVGILGGFAAGRLVSGSWHGVPLGPALGLGAAIAGGIGGYAAGSRIEVGTGHIGEHVANETVVHGDLPGTAQDFGRGMFNHFTENGPTTQGITFGRAWGMQSAFEKDYSKAEQAGGMVGDLAAAGILAGGALAVARKSATAGKAGASLSTAGNILARTNAADMVISKGGEAAAMMEASKAGSSKFGMAALAAGIGLGVAAHEYNSWSNDGKNPLAGVLAGGATIAAMGATAMLLRSKVPMFQAAAPAASALTSAALVGALSAARMPIQQFLTDSKSVKASRGKGDLAQRGIAAGVFGGVGAIGGLKLVSSLAESAVPSKRGIILAGGAVAGTILGGMLGQNFAPLLPSVGTAGLAAGAGAAALGGLTLLTTHNVRSAGTAAIMGGAAGLVGSSLVAPGQEPAAPAAS